MKNPIKEHIERNKRTMLSWFGNIKNWYYYRGINNISYDLIITNESNVFSPHEIENMISYVENNKSQFPKISPVRCIMIDNEILYFNNIWHK